MKQVTRVYHPWTKWECYRAGFYETTCPSDIDSDQAKEIYRDFLSDLDRFGRAMDRVFKEWPTSCEQFLTNPSMNRIAWLGQASLCIETGIPSCFRGGFKLLSEEQQDAANKLAEQYLGRWLDAYEIEEQTA